MTWWKVWGTQILKCGQKGKCVCTHFCSYPLVWVHVYDQTYGVLSHSRACFEKNAGGITSLTVFRHHKLNILVKLQAYLAIRVPLFTWKKSIFCKEQSIGVLNEWKLCCSWRKFSACNNLKISFEILLKQWYFDESFCKIWIIVKKSHEKWNYRLVV